MDDARAFLQQLAGIGLRLDEGGGIQEAAMSRRRLKLAVVLAACCVAAAGLFLLPARLKPRAALDVPEASRFEEPLRSALAAAAAQVEKNPASGESWGRLGMLCQAHGLNEEARRAYLKAAELEPGDRRWPHLLGTVCQLLTLHQEAGEAFLRALELDPGDLPARCILARIHQEAGRDEAARRLYEAALSADPQLVAALAGWGQLALRAGQLEVARKTLEKALSVEPRCGPAHTALAQIHAREGNESAAAFHRRFSRAALGKISLADPLMDAVLELGVSYSALMARGSRAGSLGLWEEAARLFDSAAALRRDLAEPRYRQGVSLLRAGQVDRGIETLRAAAALPGKQVESWLEIARAFQLRKDDVQARSAIERALGHDPRSAGALVARGRLAAREKNFEAAWKDFDLALSQHPDHAPAHLEKARLLLSQGQAAEALEGFERALSLEADLYEAYEGAGMARMQLGERAGDSAEGLRYREAAIQSFIEATRYFPDEKGGHISLIRALHQAGRTQESLEAIARARGLWPADPRFQPRRQ